MQILSVICVELSHDGPNARSKIIPPEAISAGEASVECWRRLLDQNPNDRNRRKSLAHGLMMLAHADHSNQGQYRDEAEQILAALVRESEATGNTQRDYASIFTVFGSLREHQRRIGEARQLLAKAVAIDPTNAWSHAKLGKAYLNTTPQIAPEVRGGVKHLIRADELSRQNGWIRGQLGWAVNQLQKIVDGADSPNVEDTYLLAVGLARCGRLAEALSYFRHAEESFSDTDQVVSESLVEIREDARQIVSSENVLAQARTFREQREVNRAMELLNALLDDELHVEALRERALCHAMGGDELSAINDAKSARHLEPTPQPFVDVLEKTANELAATREWISAAILFRWLYDETQQSRHYAYLAHCYLLLEDSERYREHCRYALEHFGTPDSNIGDKRWAASMCNFIPNAVDDTT